MNFQINPKVYLHESWFLGDVIKHRLETLQYFNEPAPEPSMKFNLKISI